MIDSHSITKLIHLSQSKHGFRLPFLNALGIPMQCIIYLLSNTMPIHQTVSFQAVFLSFVQINLVIVTWFFVRFFNIIFIFLFFYFFFFSKIGITFFLFITCFNLFLFILKINISLQGWVHICLIILLIL